MASDLSRLSLDEGVETREDPINNMNSVVEEMEDEGGQPRTMRGWKQMALLQ